MVDLYFLPSWVWNWSIGWCIWFYFNLLAKNTFIFVWEFHIIYVYHVDFIFPVVLIFTFPTLISLPNLWVFIFFFFFSHRVKFILILGVGPALEYAQPTAVTSLKKTGFLFHISYWLKIVHKLMVFPSMWGVCLAWVCTGLLNVFINNASSFGLLSCCV